MTPRLKTKHRIHWWLLICLALVASTTWLLRSGHSPMSLMHLPTQHSFDTHQFSLDDPSSRWVVVNKRRPLDPKDYAPTTVVPYMPLRLDAEDEEMHVSAVIAPKLEEMVAAAKREGANLKLASGYRSYDLQASVYNIEVHDYGASAADSESARPGTSEHQTGLAVDLEPVSRTCEVQDCFSGTAEGKWLAANAYKFGFILRYVAGKETVTGYKPEPWHVRYVGTALSEQMHHDHIQTLEEFFGLPAAPDYS